MTVGHKRWSARTIGASALPATSPGVPGGPRRAARADRAAGGTLSRGLVGQFRDRLGPPEVLVGAQSAETDHASGVFVPCTAGDEQTLARPLVVTLTEAAPATERARHRRGGDQRAPSEWRQMSAHRSDRWPA
jgi:hypothetical protein